MRIRLLASTITALTLCTIVGTQAYVLNVAKWGTSQVPYYINPVNQDVSESAATAAVQAGLATWGAQSNANFSFYYMGRTSGTSFANNGKNEIFFRNASAGSMAGETHWWYDSNNRLIDADIMFYDGGVRFFTGSSGCSGGLYIEDVAAHESGHALGLGHSSVSTATMAPSMDWCTTGLRSLDADDLAGVERLYPPAGGSTTSNTAPTVTITSPATNSSFTVGTTTKFTGSASDREDGTLSTSIVWTSSINGQLGIGSSLSAALSTGTHTITAKTTDRAGATATAKIVVIIVTAIQPSLPNGFNASAVHDVNGDGYSDLVWQHQTTGALGLWTLRGNSVTSAQLLDSPGVSDTSWKVAGTGDLNGDGRADLVWQKTDGKVAAWFLRGTAVISYGMLSIPYVEGDWKIRGVGDVNGDAKADIIWQDSANGSLAVWLMNGLTVTASRMLSVPTMPDPNWIIVGAGDINGDAKADIIWQNQATGGLAAWLLSGSVVIGRQTLSISVLADLNWKVRGVGDVNADGRADILWHNIATGSLAVWYLNSFTVIGRESLRANAPADFNWKVVGPG